MARLADTRRIAVHRSNESFKMNMDLLRRTPDLRAVADVRLMTSEDGPGRGQRILVARDAAGIAFEIAVDRGFDISSLSFKGLNIGWHSPTQMAFPSHDPDSEDDGHACLTLLAVKLLLRRLLSSSGHHLDRLRTSRTESPKTRSPAFQSVAARAQAYQYSCPLARFPNHDPRWLLDGRQGA
nr:DUF4432 family protein [Rhizobium rhizogenes]